MFKTVAILSLAVGSAYGHAFINAVQGANGLTATGFGVGTGYLFIDSDSVQD